MKLDFQTSTLTAHAHGFLYAALGVLFPKIAIGLDLIKSNQQSPPSLQWQQLCPYQTVEFRLRVSLIQLSIFPCQSCPWFAATFKRVLSLNSRCFLPAIFAKPVLPEMVLIW